LLQVPHRQLEYNVEARIVVLERTTQESFEVLEAAKRVGAEIEETHTRGHDILAETRQRAGGSQTEKGANGERNQEAAVNTR
jgi:hypothetical protein